MTAVPFRMVYHLLHLDTAFLNLDKDHDENSHSQ